MDQKYRVRSEGLPAELCAIKRVALFVPSVLGANVTLTVQVAVGASEAEQLFVCPNCVLSVPVKVIAAAKPPVNTRSVVPVLLTVTVFVSLVVTDRVPNDKIGGVTETIGLIPTPLTPTDVVFSAPLYAIDKLAVLAPIVVGVKVTLAVQLAFTARDAPQVVVRDNSLALVPVTVIALEPPP